MNISLTGQGDHENFGGDLPNLQAEIDLHREIMTKAGFNITGPAVLVPEGPDYPGSYQVWWPTVYDTEEEDGVTGWVFIGTDGVAMYRDRLLGEAAV